MAVVPLTSSFLVENLSLTLPWARWAHLLTPLVLGVAGIVIGTINVLHGYRWQGFLQLLLTIAAMLWAYLIAGFAIATSHGRGI